MDINSVEIKLQLLSQSAWGVKDIRQYYDVSDNTARKIISQAKKEFDGDIDYDRDKDYSLKCKSESVIKLFGGNSRIEEIQIQCELRRALRGFSERNIPEDTIQRP